MEEAKLINIEDWEKFGEGGVGQSYFHKTDKTLILKLNLEGWAKESTYNEYHTSKLFYELGLSTPKVYEFVTDGKRYGYISERIVGKKSYSRILADDPSRIEEVACIMAAHARELHNKVVEPGKYKNTQKAYYDMIESSDAIPSDAKEILRRYYNEHDQNVKTCIHGDFQPGNIINANGKDYWIDLGGFGFGDPVIDLCNMYLLGYILPPQMVPNLFHLTPRAFKKFYMTFLDKYFDGNVTPQVMEHIRHAALFRAGVCVAARPKAAPLLLPAIYGKNLRFKIIRFLSRFAKAEM